MDTPRRRLRKGERGEAEIKLKPEKRKDALADGGGRASEKRGMPVADDETSLENRRRTFDRDLRNCRGRRCDGRSHVHYNAKWTMVSIRGNRMHMRRLKECHQRQQRQTKKCRAKST